MTRQIDERAIANLVGVSGISLLKESIVATRSCDLTGTPR